MKCGIKKGSLKIWIIIVIAFSGFVKSEKVWATHYYFSTIHGNDLNQSNSAENPWKSISKLQAIINNLQPGDIIFLERGSVWYQTKLNFIGKSGTSSNPIKIIPYGVGPMPVLSGEKILTGATLSGNIYNFFDDDLPKIELTSQSYGRRFLGSVTVDGKHYAVSRHPNGDSYFQSSSCSSTSITDDATWSNNQWQDGFVAIKNVNWQWSAARVISNTTNVLTTTPHITTSSISAPSGAKYYYFLNAYNAMDTKGEWFFTDDHLYLYWPGSLGEVRASVVDTIVNISNSHYIYFESIHFRGSNFYGVKIREGNYNKFNLCKFSGIGEIGIYVYGRWEAYPSPGASEGNEITNCEFSDIQLCSIFYRYSRGGKITNNYIHRNAMDNAYHNLKQDYESNPINGFSIGVFNNLGGNPIIQRNFIDSTAGGIITHYNPFDINIRENFISNYGLSEISDIAGFYLVSDTHSSVQKSFKRNFIIDAHKPQATMYHDYTDAYTHAVYFDVDSYSVKADSNTIQNTSTALCANSGKYRSYKFNNILNPNMYGMHPAHANAIYHSYLLPLIGGGKAESDTILGNIFAFGSIPTRAYSFWRYSSSYGSQFPINSMIDYNKYFDPSNTSSTISIIYDQYYAQNTYNLTQWQAAAFTYNSVTYNPDDHSSYNNTPYSAVKLFKNFSSRSKTFSLTAQYVDENGTLVNDSVTVPAFYSKFLFCIGGNSINDNDLYIDPTIVPALSWINEDEVVQNSAPMAHNADFVVEETGTLPTIIGTVVASDPDAGQSLSFSIISGNDQNLFTINNIGQLSFKTNDISFTGNPKYIMIVRVSDNGTPSLSSDATISVELHESGVVENHSPVIAPQSFEADYSMEVPVKLGTIAASDEDQGQHLMYEIVSGNEDDLFSLGSQTGDLYLTNLPANQIPGSYKFVVKVKDDADQSLSAQNTITVNIGASTIVYIDPEKSAELQQDGSYQYPFSSWSQVVWQEGFRYLQKKGTVVNEEKVIIGANNVIIGDYGIGERPVINCSTNEYALKVMEKHDVSIRNLEVRAENAVGCIYFIGAECVENTVENCNLLGADYGLRIIDGTSYRVKYNVFSNKVDGIYSIADFAEIYYNVFKGNHTAINLSSYSSSAQIYNNVFYDNRQGISTSYAEISLFNNIFYLTLAGDQAINHKLDKLVSNNNVFYPEQSGFIEVEETKYDNLADYQRYYGLDMNSFSEDPKFVDVYNDNFSVMPESRVIDAGRIVGLTEDFLGQPVPYGGAPDIGLVELAVPTAVQLSQSDNKNELSVYPNPSSGIFRLSFLNTSASMSAELIINAISGMEVYRQLFDMNGIFNGEIDLSGFPQGIYFLSIKAGDSMITQRLIKQ